MATETTPELVRTPSEALPDAVRLDHVSKVYGRGEGAVIALDRVTVGLRSGSFTAVMGPSGSGKSTFLHCAAGLDARTSGDILALLRHVVDALGQTVVMVTHDPLAAAYADRVLYLADGAVVAEDVAPTADTVAERMTHLGA